MIPALIVYAVVDDALSADFPLGDSLEVFVRREDAERFIEEVRGDDPALAAHLTIRERKLEAGGAELRTRPSHEQATFTDCQHKHGRAYPRAMP
jgi:hypothetical protein